MKKNIDLFLFALLCKQVKSRLLILTLNLEQNIGRLNLQLISSLLGITPNQKRKNKQVKSTSVTMVCYEVTVVNITFKTSWVCALQNTMCCHVVLNKKHIITLRALKYF